DALDDEAGRHGDGRQLVGGLGGIGGGAGRADGEQRQQTAGGQEQQGQGESSAGGPVGRVHGWVPPGVGSVIAGPHSTTAARVAQPPTELHFLLWTNLFGVPSSGPP